MNPDQSLQSPSIPATSSAVASNRALHSSRASPLPPTTTAGNETMGGPAFRSVTQAFRFGLGPQSPFPFTANRPDREPFQSAGAPFRDPSAPPVRVLIRCLPLNTSEESLRLMVVWSQELVRVELLPIERSEDRGFLCAIITFKTMAGALEAKAMLDGRSNISNDAQMSVQVLATSPVAATTRTNDIALAHQPGATTSASGTRQPRTFKFPSIDTVSPTSPGVFSANEFPKPESTSHYQSLFSPQSPVGNHLADRGTRISGKTLISNDFGDDDETRDLLNNPVAYAENGATSQRRATAPQIPISQMASLSLNTSAPPGPSSLPHYMTSMSPATATAPAQVRIGYPLAGRPPYGRLNPPPVNPSDQHPPCNTLYVGNLPMDTSEEELKAMFSRQRGYKRLCFRTKTNGPMCFVEFEDVSFATKALHELYGQLLHNSVKGGIRLSFSKNPLGVRSSQNPVHAQQAGLSAMNGMNPGPTNGFMSVSRPPPGLAVPPGLGAGRANYHMNAGGANHRHGPFGLTSVSSHPWNPPFYHNGMATVHNGTLFNANSNHLPRHMMGR